MNMKFNFIFTLPRLYRYPYHFIELPCLVLGMLTVASLAFAQGPAPEVHGTVVDTTGAAVPHARVTLRRASHGFERSVRTDALGCFRLEAPSEGDYELNTEAEGFSVEEIGEILGLNVNTVKVRLFRARGKLVKIYRRRMQRSE